MTARRLGVVSLEYRVAALERWREEQERREAERAMWRLWFQASGATVLLVGVVTFVVASFLKAG